MWTTFLTVFGIAFVFIMTALGSAVVFFFKGEIPAKYHCAFLGFASGVMLSASVWSLLLPAIAQSEEILGDFAFLTPAIGLLLGGAFLAFIDKFTPTKSGETSLLEKRKAKRLFLAVTMHNIPEGLAVGFAFGVAVVNGSIGAYMSALALAIGIGVQNFPEGTAVALPVKGVYKSNTKAFLWGACSGIAEPIFAVIGLFLATKLRALQPWLLSFSAGAMLFVSAQDLIPDSKTDNSLSIGAWGVMLGFTVMMALDVALS